MRSKLLLPSFDTNIDKWPPPVKGPWGERQELDWEKGRRERYTEGYEDGKRRAVNSDVAGTSGLTPTSANPGTVRCHTPCLPDTEGRRPIPASRNSEV